LVNDLQPQKQVISGLTPTPSSPAPSRSMRASPWSLESGRRSVTDSPVYCSTSDYCFLTLSKQLLLPWCRVRPQDRRRRRRCWPNALAYSPAWPASRTGRGAQRTWPTPSNKAAMAVQELLDGWMDDVNSERHRVVV
jgi:hypothetical protein